MTLARSDYLRKSWRSLIPAALPWAALAIPALLLFLPVLYYSLTTPFALVDDYGDWGFVRVFDSPEQFSRWFDHRIIGLDYNLHEYQYEYENQYQYRHRPFWEFYNVVAWNVFGPTPWLHHLARWVVHFGAVFAFAGAFLCFARQLPAAGHNIAARFFYILPLTLLVYLWLFFPNQPAARLGPQEVYTVFFLGLGSWMLALLLLREGSQNRLRATLLIYGVFYLSYLGLAWSKEVNIAMALWLLVSYYALLLIGAWRRKDRDAGPVLPGVSRWKLLGGLPLLAVFLHTLWRLTGVVSQGGGYDPAPLTPGLIGDNAGWITGQLFLVNTSPFITAGLALLVALLLFLVIGKAVKGQFSNEVIFLLFLLGLFASMYLIVGTSWAQVLRYWYILIPVFTTLLAFSARFALEYAGELRPLRGSFASFTPTPRLLAASGLVGFIVFFVCCNYYNFLFQTVVQHHARQAEARLLAEITRRHDQGHYIQVLYENPNELTKKIILYYREFLPRFYGGEYAIHTEPPAQSGPPWYVVAHTGEQHNQLRNYRPLSYAWKVADRLQVGHPYLTKDGGVPLWEWYIYRSDLARFWWNGQEAGEPAIRAAFDVYLVDNVLIYTKEPCNPEDVAAKFLLHLYPVDINDLPSYRQEHGFDNLGFSFEQYGLLSGGKCLARVALPEYAVAAIRTGQFVPAADGSNQLWEGEIRLVE